METLGEGVKSDTKMMSMTSFWCFCCWIWTDFTHCSDVSIDDFEHVNPETAYDISSEKKSWKNFSHFALTSQKFF